MSTTSVTDDETCVLALIWTSDVELELFCVGGMSCNREVLCGGIIEDSWDGCSPRTELVIMSPIACFSFDETHRFVSGNCHNLCHWTVSSEDSCTRCTNWVVGVDLWKVYFNFFIEEKNIFFVHTTVLSLKTAFNLVKIHLLFRIVILIQWSVNISVFVNHVVIVFWGPNEGDRKRTYIPRLFSEYMLTFRVE